MTISQEKKLEYLYQEYVRISQINSEHLRDTYNDIKLFGAIGALVIIWKPISDFISSTNAGLDSNLVLLLGFIGIEIIFAVISVFNLIKQANAWFYVSHLQAYELKIKQILDENENTKVFQLYHEVGQSRYMNGLYRTAFTFWGAYVKFSVTIFPAFILCFVNLTHAIFYFSFSLVNTLLLAVVAKRIFRYYPGKNIVAFKYLFTHVIREGPIDR